MRLVWVLVLMVGVARGQVLGSGAGSGGVGFGMTSELVTVDGVGVVTGHPYSLVRMTTSVHTLGDGTKVTHVSEQRKMRDSAGRTRTEMGTLKDGVFTEMSCFIDDPLERRHIMLMMKSKLARVSSMPAQAPMTEDQRVRLEAARARMEAARKENRQETEGAAEPRTIVGVYVEGKRTTRVIPVGQMGNDREMRTVTEVWYSQDLKVEMGRRRESPQTGTVSTEVTELKREEPDPGLFQVPQGYRVMEPQ
jgi:hypothetical protein